ncbi:MAG: YdeI/OmpD-associated family protein [Myxococcota bacterium]
MRCLKFRSTVGGKPLRKHAVALIEEAMALEREGNQVKAEAPSERMPDELPQRRAAADADALKKAFDALTPGRQRSHSLCVSAAESSEAGVRRAEKCATKIVDGKGFHER